MQHQLATFLEFLQEERQYSDNTIAAYRNDLGQFITFLEQKYPSIASFNDVTADVVNHYVKDMKTEKRYASSSVARKVAAIKSFFHHLFAHSQITQDPTQDTDSPKVEKRLPTTLSIDEVDRLLEAPTRKQTPKHFRDSALLILLYATGMRVTEAVSLDLSDLDLERNLLVCPSKDGEDRVLPFDDEASLQLKQYLEEGRPHLAKGKDDSALFLNHRGQQLTRQGLWLIIKAYAKEANLGNEVTPHTLRHSFAAHKLRTGTDLQEVQQLLGHANISTTQIYTHLAEEETPEAN